MRLAIDATCLGGARAGIWNYTREIVSRLPHSGHDTTVDLFLGHRWASLGEYWRDQGDAPATTVRARVAPTIKRLPGAQFLWTRLKERAFRAGLERNPCDVLWAPCFLPPVMSGRTVVTVHDLSHVRFPQHHPPARVRWLDTLESAVSTAARVIAVSEFTRDEIVDVYGLAPSRIDVIANGISARYRPQGEDLIARVTSGYGLRPGDYFLSVCTLEPRKNLTRLIEAYGRLPETIQRRTPLVLVGGTGWGRDATRAALSRLPVHGQVLMPGYVPDADLPALYSGCAAFIYGSVYEGFGLPVAEAMACGAPVVISDAPALVEVAGTGATVVPARDTAAWSRALEQVWVLGEDGRAAVAADNALHARRYSWDDCAHRHASLLAQVAGEPA